MEVDRLAVIAPAEFGEFVRILDVFDTAYRERLTAVDMFKRPLTGLSPLELLVYASLYAFEHLVPQDFLPVDDPSKPNTPCHGHSSGLFSGSANHSQKSGLCFR